MKLLYAIAFALFASAPVTASAQSPTRHCRRHSVLTTTTRTRLPV